jgi:hypothetical protein
LFTVYFHHEAAEGNERHKGVSRQDAKTAKKAQKFLLGALCGLRGIIFGPFLSSRHDHNTIDQ